MWQRFTERARKVVFYAQEEAGLVGQNSVGPEHILAGLIRDHESFAASLIVESGVSLESIHSTLSERMTRSEARLGQDMQLTAGAKRVIDHSYLEARGLSNNYIGTEHLLLGLFYDRENLAGQILREHRLEIDPLRQAVIVAQTDRTSSNDDSAPSAPVVERHSSDSTTGFVVVMANSMIGKAIRAGASDLHLELTDHGARVKHRIDGVLNEVTFLSDPFAKPLIARFKVLANLDPERHDIPQSGIFTMLEQRENYELEIFAVPVHKGEKIVIRIPRDSPIGFSELGLLEDDTTTLQTWTARRSGLILVSGSTGQGKTATSLSLLREILDAGGSAVALQTPFDPEMPGVTVFSVDAKTGMTLETALEVALREGPDVISISTGSLSPHPFDLSLRLVLDAALSGSLVVLESHAPSAAGALNRLLSRDVPLRPVNDALIGVVGQSLVRRICENCKQPSDQPISHETRDQARLDGFDPPADVVLHIGSGCDLCRGTGYKGRIGLFELLPWNKEICEAARREASADELTALAVTHGMTTRFADGIRKARLGLTTVDEVERRIFRRG